MPNRSDRDAVAEASAKFWDWFAAEARNRKHFDDPEFISSLERRLHAIHDGLSWEIGPGERRDFALAISPSLRPELIETALAVVKDAPRMERWEVLAGRPSRPWQPVFTIEAAEGRRLAVDASEWEYLLLRYEDGSTELVVLAPNLDLPDDERWTAAAIVIEGLVGEIAALPLLSDLAVEREVDPVTRERMKRLVNLPRALGVNSRWRPPT